jgi:hypothetical protein
MPYIPNEADQPAQTYEEIWLEANERLRIAIEAMGENAKNGIEDLEFEDGNQWPDDLYNMRRLSRRPTLTINLTRTMVRRVCNNMRQQRPRIKVHPTGDGAKVEDAKVISGLIRHIENLSKASVAYDTGGESAVKIGWGYWRVLADYIDAERSEDQELKIHAIRNVFKVYDDPMCQLPTGADREWLLITESMKRQKYRRLYPKAENIEWRAGGPGDEDRLWESPETVRLAEYYRIKHDYFTVYSLTDGLSMPAKDFKRLEAQLAQQSIFQARDTGGEIKSRKADRRTVEWYRINGREVVDKRTLPGKWIPVIRCLGNVLDINGQVRYRGMVRDCKDSNRMLNYWATCETEIVALAPRAPFVAAEGQLDGHPEWKDANQKPYSALVYKPVTSNPQNPDSPVLPPPQRVPVTEVPAGIVNARDGAAKDLMTLAGMPHEPGVDKPGEVVSGIALQRRQALSDIGHFQYYDNQTMAIAHTGEILLDLIPHYYSSARMQRIIGEDGVPQMVAINQKKPSAMNPAIMEVKNDLTVGRYDVVMDTGPGYETKRMEGQEAMIDLLKTPLAEPIVKVGSDLIVRNMDFAGADDLADRLLPTNPAGMQKAIQNLPKEAQGIVQALQTQLTQAQGIIQQQALELKYKGGIEQMKEREETRRAHLVAETKVHDTETRAATAIKDAHIKSVTARDVAEINAGAKLMDSHVQGGYDLEAAKHAEKAAEKAEKSNGAG